MARSEMSGDFDKDSEAQSKNIKGKKAVITAVGSMKCFGFLDKAVEYLFNRID